MIGLTNDQRDLEVSPHGHRRLSTVLPRDRPRQAHPGPARGRRVHRLRRRLDRQRCAPLDPERPSFLGTGSAMGPERVLAHLRRLHAAGRPRRRPPRPQPRAGRPHRGERHSARLADFDLRGAVIATGGMLLLVFGLVEAPDQGWGAASTIAELTGALVLLGAFAINERRIKNPLLPLSIFRVKGLAAADTTQLVAFAGLLSMFFFLTLYM